MEQLKSITELTHIDETHLLMGQVTGRCIDLELLHNAVTEITMHDGVPESIRGQFNVARNMALYQYFFYALAPEVQLKTYTVIELALRTRAGDEGLMMGALIRMAVTEGWIQDKGFRHLENHEAGNPYCHSLLKVLPKLRNMSAHGSSHLTPECVGHLEKCADLVNQIFPAQPLVQKGI